jgi:hypothetical protein
MVVLPAGIGDGALMRASVATVRRAARLYVLLTLGVVAFQFALVGGAPWGHLTQGGRHAGALPPSQRAIAAVSTLLLLAAAGVVGSGAGLWGARWHAGAAKGTWVVVCYLALGVVLNTITPSAAERALWLPVTIALLATAVIVARGAGAPRR